MSAPRLGVLFAVMMLFLCSCNGDRAVIKINAPALRAAKFDAEFRRIWDDGSSEMTTFRTERLRGGVLQKGTATAVTRRVTFSEDERVPVDRTAAPPQGDLFPAMEMNWLERCSDGPQDCSEMTTSVLTMSSVDGRAAGTETKTNYSFQGWDGQLFHQLLFDATGVRSHQYSYFASEGDEQITLAYPSDGVAGDALWFWARHMAAPALNPGEHVSVLLLPALRGARSQHNQLSWKRAVLERAGASKPFQGRSTEAFSLRWEDGRTAAFYVEDASPYRVLHFENSSGERVDLVSGTRIQKSDKR